MKKYRIIFMLILALILIVSLYSCNDSDSGQTNQTTDTETTTTQDTADENTVVMQNFKFQPAEITIKKGDTVTWINQDSAGHDVVSSLFKSDSLKKGESFAYTFNETGTFDYVCSFHNGMDGTVIVE